MSDTTIELDPLKVVENGLRLDIITLDGLGVGEGVTVTPENLVIQHVVELDDDTVLDADTVTNAVETIVAEGRTHERFADAEGLGLMARLWNPITGDDAAMALVIPFTDTYQGETAEGSGYDEAVISGKWHEAMVTLGHEAAEAYEAIGRPFDPMDMLR